MSSGLSTWVVGGFSGIGRAVCDSLSVEREEYRATGSETDVRSLESLREFYDAKGPFDRIVYSAGINYLDWSSSLDLDKAQEVMNVNAFGLIRVLQAAGNVGRVVVVGSDAAWRPMRTSSAYNASKAALHEIVRCIARERAAEDFAINVVAPGLVAPTFMTDYVIERTGEVRGWSGPATEDYMIGQIPIGRPAAPFEVASVVLDVLEMPISVNGAIIPVNGAR